MDVQPLRQFHPLQGFEAIIDGKAIVDQPVSYLGAKVEFAGIVLISAGAERERVLIVCGNGK
jgi:hypothetical protein